MDDITFVKSERFESPDAADEVMEEFVLLWRPNVLLPNEGQDDPSFVPTTSGSWRPRMLKAVIEKQEINIHGREGDEEIRSISGELTVRKIDAAGTLRLSCQIGALENASIFAISEKFPVRFANPDTLPPDDVQNVQRLAQLSGSKDLKTVALSGLQKENPNHLVQFVYGNMGMRLVTGDGRAHYFAFRNPQICDRWVTSLREVIRTQLELETFTAPSSAVPTVPASVSGRSLDVSNQVGAFLADLDGAASRASKKSVGPPSNGYIIINRDGRPSKWLVRLDSSIDQSHPERTMDRPQLIHFIKAGKTLIQMPSNALRRALPVSLLDTNTVDAKKLTLVVDRPFSKEFFLQFQGEEGNIDRLEVAAASLENRLQWEDWFCRFGATKASPILPPEVINPDEAFEYAHNISFKRYRSGTSPSRSTPLMRGNSLLFSPLGPNMAQTSSLSEMTTPQMSLRKSATTSQRNLPDGSAPIQIVVTQNPVDDRIEDLELPNCVKVDSLFFKPEADYETSSTRSDNPSHDELEVTLSPTARNISTKRFPDRLTTETSVSSKGKAENSKRDRVLVRRGSSDGNSNPPSVTQQDLSPPAHEKSRSLLTVNYLQNAERAPQQQVEAPAVLQEHPALASEAIATKPAGAAAAQRAESPLMQRGPPEDNPVSASSATVNEEKHIDVSRHVIQRAIRMRVAARDSNKSKAVGAETRTSSNAPPSSVEAVSPASARTAPSIPPQRVSEPREYTWAPDFRPTVRTPAKNQELASLTPSQPHSTQRTSRAPAAVETRTAPSVSSSSFVAVSSREMVQTSSSLPERASDHRNNTSSRDLSSPITTKVDSVNVPSDDNKRDQQYHQPVSPLPSQYPHAQTSKQESHQQLTAISNTPIYSPIEAATPHRSTAASDGALSPVSEVSRSTPDVHQKGQIPTALPQVAKSPFFTDLRTNSDAFRYELSPSFCSPPSVAKKKSDVELFRESIVSLRSFSEERSPSKSNTTTQHAVGEICAICRNDKLLVSNCTVTGKTHQLLSQCRLLRRSPFPVLEDPPEVKQAKKILGF